MTVVHGDTTGWFPDGGDFHIGMVWSEMDPLAVRLDFSDVEGGEVTVSWTVARQLLHAGSLLTGCEATGEGDVVIGATRAAGTRLLTLRTPTEGESTVLVGWRPVKEFLRRTALVIPHGEENLTDDLNEWLNRTHDLRRPHQDE